MTFRIPQTFALLPLLAFGLFGCGFGEPANSVTLRAPLSNEDFPPSILESPETNAPARLTSAYFSHLQARGEKRVAVSLTSEQGTDSGRSTLRLPLGRRPARLSIPLGLHADQYNRLQVTMRVDAGDTATVQWTTLTPPLRSAPQAIALPINSDGEWHTYEFALTGPYDTQWAGEIEEIEFLPSDAPAEIEIESIELVFRPPDGHRKITLNAQTHEAIVGSPPDWQIAIPPNARFEAYVGLPPGGARSALRKQATFRVEIEGEDSSAAILAEKLVDARITNSGYHRVSADLSGFANQKVVLRFQVDASPASLGPSAIWGAPTVYSTNRPKRSPVILISVDTLRADRLSCYGHSRETTPYLDRFARESVVFDNAVCQETYTLSSHVSMLTGLYPKNHLTTPHTFYGEERITLPELLQRKGYATAGFTGIKSWLKPEFGFGQGFDIYNTPEGMRRTVFETHAPAIEWLRQGPRPGPFLFLHNYDVHSYPTETDRRIRLPYGPSDPAFLKFSNTLEFPESLKQYAPKNSTSHDFFADLHAGRRKLSEEELEYVRALYDDAVLSVDHAINDVFDVLKELGLYHDALIIITSDHGEALGERDPHGRQEYGHGWVYDNNAKVPLIVKFPGGRFGGQRYEGLVQTVDIVPTLVDALGLETPGPLDGRSLLALLEEREKPAPYAYTQRNAAQSVRDATWKLIRDSNADAYEFFDTVDDPGEDRDRFRDNPDSLEPMTGELYRFYSMQGEGWHVLWSRPGNQTREIQLELLGENSMARATLLQGDRISHLNFTGDRPYIERTDRSMSVHVGRLHEERIHVPSSGGALRFRLSGPDPVRVVVGDSVVAVEAAWEATLTPDGATRAVDSEESLRRDTDTPVLRIWFQPPQAESSTGSVLTNEEKAELESLGYFQ